MFAIVLYPVDKNVIAKDNFLRSAGNKLTDIGKINNILVGHAFIEQARYMDREINACENVQCKEYSLLVLKLGRDRRALRSPRILTSDYVRG